MSVDHVVTVQMGASELWLHGPHLVWLHDAEERDDERRLAATRPAADANLLARCDVEGYALAANNHPDIRLQAIVYICQKAQRSLHACTEPLTTDLQHGRQLRAVPHPNAPVRQGPLCRPVVLRPAAKMMHSLRGKQMPHNALRPFWWQVYCGDTRNMFVVKDTITDCDQ